MNSKSRIEIEMSWHHICPFRLLRRVWNNVIAYGDTDIMSNYIKLWQVHYKSMANTPIRAILGNISVRNQLVRSI